MSDLKQLIKLTEKHDIEVTLKPNYHVQLKGPLLVNYYPSSKTRTAYVAGTTGGRKWVAPEEAIAMCFKAPTAKTRIDKRKSSYKRQKAALWKKGIKRCFWCEKELTLETATMEHKIPLSRGGLDNANNRTLACAECNHGRSSEMPELSKLNR